MDEPATNIAHLAQTLDEAVRRAVAASGVSAPFMLWFGLGRHGAPLGWVAAAEFRDRMLAAGRSMDEVVAAGPALTPPDGAPLDVVLDDEALERCDQLGGLISAAQSGDARAYAEANDRLQALRRKLTASLNDGWPHPHPDFVAFVPIAATDGFIDMYDAVAEVVGVDRVARFRKPKIPLKRSAPVKLGAADSGQQWLAAVLTSHGLDAAQTRRALQCA